jgi:hypothetical protein
MRIHCLSCRREINLNHPVSYDYQGPAKCFACGQMVEIATAHGSLTRSSLRGADAVIPELDLGKGRSAVPNQMKA